MLQWHTFKPATFTVKMPDSNFLLLWEAVQFYNYVYKQKPLYIIKNEKRRKREIEKTWLQFNRENLLPAIKELRREYFLFLKNNIRKHILNKFKNDPLAKVIPEEYVRDKYAIRDKGNRAQYIVRAMVSPKFRRAGVDEKKFSASIIFLDKLTPLRNILRENLHFEVIKNRLAYQYDQEGPSIFNPVESYYPTISLHGCLHDDFEREYDSHKHVNKKVTEHPCHASRFIETIISDLKQYSLPLLKGNWKVWLKNLEMLENMYAHSVNREPYLVGLFPWACVLISVLKGYIYDVMARTMMVSLPVYGLHQDVSGYAAVALWETLANERFANEQITSFINTDIEWRKAGDLDVAELASTNPEDFIGALESWNRGPVKEIFEKSTPPHDFIQFGGWLATHVETEAKRAFGEIIKKSLIYEPALKKRPSQSRAISDFKRDTPRFPIIERKFFRVSKLWKRPHTSDLSYAGNYIGQAHLFVTGNILARCLQPILGKDPDENPEYWYLDVTAGSYTFSGKKEPHQTHRDGYCFDLVYELGKLPGWPVAKIAKILKKYLSSNPGYNSPDRKQPLVICKDITEKKAAKEPLLPTNYIIFRPWARSIINTAFYKVGHQIKKSMQGSGAISVKEKNAYKQAEKVLKGTPHFNSISSFEKTVRPYLAHLAIFLSAPYQIVFASPIMHLRLMQVIRQAFQDNKKASKVAANVVINTLFAFLPHNHHDHWHVDFVDIPAENKDSSLDNDVFAKVSINALEKFKSYFPLWMDLGVDFRPFLKHLNSIRALDLGPQGEIAAEERKGLIAALNEYIKDHEVKGFEVDTQRMAKLINPFTVEGALNKPLLKPVGKEDLSGELFRKARKATALCTLARNWYEIEHAPEKVKWLDFYSFETYEELFGKDEVDE
jgi:hypothetical protein